MTESAQHFVCEALLHLAEGTDPALVGAVVTTALCGHWEHEGPCRWPHNNEIDAASDGFRFRTLYVAVPEEEPDVRARIEAALRGGDGWRVVAFAPRELAAAEQPLGAQLATLPRRGG